MAMLPPARQLVRLPLLCSRQPPAPCASIREQGGQADGMDRQALQGIQHCRAQVRLPRALRAADQQAGPLHARPRSPGQDATAAAAAAAAGEEVLARPCKDTAQQEDCRHTWHSRKLAPSPSSFDGTGSRGIRDLSRPAHGVYFCTSLVQELSTMSGPACGTPSTGAAAAHPTQHLSKPGQHRTCGTPASFFLPAPPLPGPVLRQAAAGGKARCSCASTRCSESSSRGDTREGRGLQGQQAQRAWQERKLAQRVP
jgi:hypothetical protein